MSWNTALAEGTLYRKPSRGVRKNTRLSMAAARREELTKERLTLNKAATWTCQQTVGPTRHRHACMRENPMSTRWCQGCGCERDAPNPDPMPGEWKCQQRVGLGNHVCGHINPGDQDWCKRCHCVRSTQPALMPKPPVAKKYPELRGWICDGCGAANLSSGLVCTRPGCGHKAPWVLTAGN